MEDDGSGEVYLALEDAHLDKYMGCKCVVCRVKIVRAFNRDIDDGVETTFAENIQHLGTLNLIYMGKRDE